MKSEDKICTDHIAAVDVGTNTIRLLIGCVKNGKVIREVSKRYITRLGRNLLETGVLHQKSILNSIEFIINIKDTCENCHVKHIVAVGTSAVREALNSQDFLSLVEEKTGIEINVITGEMEADLTLTGIMNDAIFTGVASIIIDIGGGSTEWVYSEKLKPINMGSIPIGAVKLKEKYVKHDPPLPSELESVRNYIHEIADPIFKTFAGDPSVTLTATGGTATAIASIDLGLEQYNGDIIHSHKVTISSLSELYNSLSVIPYNKRTEFKGMEPERADIIIPGMLILMCIMETLQSDGVIMSDHGLLEGLILKHR